MDSVFKLPSSAETGRRGSRNSGSVLTESERSRLSQLEARQQRQLERFSEFDSEY